MWLPWQYAVWIAAAAAVATLVLHTHLPSARWVWVRELAREIAIFTTLYAVWQGVGQLPAAGDISRATARGRAIAHLEHALHLPSEQWIQRIALHNHLVIKGANWYYIVGHTPALAMFLVWLYVRHRGEFARWRTVLAIGSIAGELIQIIPVAPPRLAIQVVDTGLVYGPAVYDAQGAGFAPQLAAMPSLHCVWAITVGVATFRLARARWRWLGPAHIVVTVLTVTVTGNHYWMDAIAGGGLVLVGLAVHDGVTHLWRWRMRAAEVPAPEPVPDTGVRAGT